MMFWKIAGGIIVGFTVLIVGCSALFAAGVEESFSEGAITAEQYDSLKLGRSTKAGSLKRFGEPFSTDESEVELEGLSDEAFTSDCSVYNGEPDWETTYVLCWTADGKLESRSKF